MMIKGHKFYPEKLVLEARRLRKQGLSSAKISRILKIKGGRSTVSRWCNHILPTNTFPNKAKGLRTESLNKGIVTSNFLKIDEDMARILSGMLYWCEGAKYPSTNFISFTNSDVTLIKTFLELFRIGFKPKEEKLRARLQLHTTHDVKNVTNFWSKTLNIPVNQFYKPTITRPTQNMKRMNYNGTCDIRYYDIYLLMEMIGIFEGFAKKFNK